MTRAQSFLMGAAGALALLVAVVGVAWAADIFTVDKDGTVRLSISGTGATTISASDNVSPALSINQNGSADAASFIGGSGVTVNTATGKLSVTGDGGVLTSIRNFPSDGNTSRHSLQLVRLYSAGAGSAGIGNHVDIWAETTSEGVYGLLCQLRATTTDATSANFTSNIYLNPTANGVPLSNTFVLTSNQWLGIGRIPTANALEIEGNASKTAAGSWLANSDRRIKTDIRDIVGALETIERLRPVKFRYTDDYRAKHPSIENRDYENFIAQEFQQVFPECVKDDGTGLLQVDTYNVIPTLVAAAQELSRKNREMETKLRMLEEKMKGDNR